MSPFKFAEYTYGETPMSDGYNKICVLKLVLFMLCEKVGLLQYLWK
jgi:hypothetical protein